MTKEEMMKRYPQMNESVIDDIRAEIGPFMAELYELAREVDRQIEQQRLQQEVRRNDE